MSDSLFVMNITLMLEEIEKRKLNEPGRQELERQKRFKRTLFKFANTRCKFSRNVLFVKLRISYLEHKTNYWVHKQEQLSCGSAGTSSGSCLQMDTLMVRACHDSSLSKAIRQGRCLPNASGICRSALLSFLFL